MSDSTISEWKRSAYVNRPGYNWVQEKNAPYLWGKVDDYDDKLKILHQEIYSATTSEIRVPGYLIRFFTVGITVALAGAIIWLLSQLVHSDGLGIGGAIGFACGSVTVAISLLRGQDINGR